MVVMNHMHRLLFVIVFLVGCSDSYQEKRFLFEPLEFDGNSFVLISERVNKEHFDNVEIVLNYYEIDYQRTGPTEIEIPNGLAPEILMNFSGKAENHIWLEQREGKPESENN